MPAKLVRHAVNPVLYPDPLKPWEALNVFNAAVVERDGLWFMHYRAQGVDFVSSIGLAVSTDGLSWNKLERPVMVPETPLEGRGVEDPRVTYLEDEDRYVMAYTAYSKKGEITPCFATSRDLIRWERLGPLVQGEDNKDHVLFPKKVNGKYLSFHRRPPSIWLAESDDLKTWTNHRVVMEPTGGDAWDGNRIGAGGVPIHTPEGWLIVYHAYNQDHVYRLGAAILDLNDPTKVLHRSKGFLIEPSEPWEIKGDVPNVIFSCANPVVDGTVFVYYGGADRCVGLATISLADLIDFAKNG
ncbi:MAG TPA: glycosidase [Deinococcales bacterium]|nr:glycosidase [Deinococcales bacterium]